MKKAAFWILAFLITASTAVYQRRTGPTYPVSGKTTIANTLIRYELLRTHETGKDCPVQIEAQNPEISGAVLYKRHKTSDPWARIPMERQADSLVAALPQQPPAGKLQYKVVLSHFGDETSLSGENPVIIRFKGAVPIWILIPHVFVMFMAMLFSARTGIEALRPKSNPRKLALWTTGILFVGGFIFGPLVQKFAFGALWTGFPFGFDLTDNKTLIAFVGWIIALIAGRKGKPARGWVLAAAILLLIIFLIPHSVLGSELDYSKMDTSQAFGLTSSPSFIMPLKMLI
jgi:hypothetical protein